MIILDIETTGTDPKKHCMVSLGAVDYETGQEFYGECSIYAESLCEPIAMDINGFCVQEIQPGLKNPPHVLYRDFLVWSEQFPDKQIGGHNVGSFDVQFLKLYHTFFPIPFEWPFGYRTIDLHSVAFAVLRKSLSHEKICAALGLPSEPKPHNALAGARSERDAFKLLLA